MSGLDHLDYEDVLLFAEVHRLVGKAVTLAGSVPALSDPRWLTAPPARKIAGLLVLAEAYLIRDPDAIAAQMIKDASAAVSSAGLWSAARALPSHAELMRRRAEPGRTWRPFDPVAARCWVETGSSEEPAA